MNVKARLQGNSIVATFPKNFNIIAGTIFEPVQTEEGILFKFVENDDFFKFDKEILISLIEEGYEGTELVNEFIERKKKIPEKIDKLIKEAREEAINSQAVSREDF